MKKTLRFNKLCASIFLLTFIMLVQAMVPISSAYAANENEIPIKNSQEELKQTVKFLVNANNNGSGVYVGVTWVAVFNVEPL